MQEKMLMKEELGAASQIERNYRQLEKVESWASTRLRKCNSVGFSRRHKQTTGEEPESHRKGFGGS